MPEGSYENWIRLQGEVNQYFKNKNLSKKGNKTLLMLASAMALVFFIGVASFYNYQWSYVQILIGATILGLLGGYLGALGHEAVHYCFSSSKRINQMMYSFQDFFGLGSTYYRFKHQVHHHYTNEIGIDPDVELEPFLRIEESQDLKWYHKFQHLYATLLYMVTIPYLVLDPWSFVSQKIGAFKYDASSFSSKIRLVFIKLSPLFFLLALPIYLQGTLKGILFYLLIQVFGGLYLSFIIQPGHVFESTKFHPLDESIKVSKRNWLNQISSSTCSFNPSSSFLNYVTAGMNNHMVHSLFPNISHVHYPELYSIIKRHLDENKYQYTEFDSFYGVLKSHFQHLKTMGQAVR